MARAKFSIGIDLGTTNCAMAFEALDEKPSQTEVFPISQLETITAFVEASTLPSFLYLPPKEEINDLAGADADSNRWIPGRLARKKAAESPGRVAHSAKSWLCHHAVDRTAPFLPWRSDEILPDKRISPIQASALLLEYLRAVWDARFARAGHFFNDQEVTVTVPASFDAVAQALTLDATSQAGFPEKVRLLEEPQAAFYCWLEDNNLVGGTLKQAAGHVLVIDIGGGTTDLSLFEIIAQTGESVPRIKRVAVSDHLLLGGDNIDLALAHNLEPRLSNEPLSPVQWNFLVARCRDLKEQCFSEQSNDIFPIAVPGRGSSLFGGTLRCRITRTEIESIVLDGFFPDCALDSEPARVQTGLREWALPYAVDSAITRYLADFLRGRLPIQSVLFNGGSLQPEPLRHRLLEQIGRWQNGLKPHVLNNSEPSLAVARGAARFGRIIYDRSFRIEADAARSLYLEVHRRPDQHSKSPSPTLLCILASDASTEEEFQIADVGLELRLNRAVRFQTYYSTHRSEDKIGELVAWNERDFRRLPPLQTIAKLSGRSVEGERLPVTLNIHINELGLLRIACVSAIPLIRETWPLEFNLRTDDPEGSQRSRNEPAIRAALDPGVEPARLETAQARIQAVFSRPLDRRDKLTAANLFKSLERIFGAPKAEWNWVLIRSLWQRLLNCHSDRSRSVEHEETWLILGGFFLRPGFGGDGDESRIDDLWRVQAGGPAHPGKRVQIQEFILWRRVAGGLSRERQEQILAPQMPQLGAGKSVAAELVRLAGSLERIDVHKKIELVDLFLAAARGLAAENQHCAPQLAALGLLLNRAPLCAGPEAVIPPSYVERVFDTLSDFEWIEPDLGEIQTLFLRAARVVDNPKIDIPKSLRQKIASKLEKWGVVPVRLARIRSFVPIAATDRASLFGESLPSGLVLRNDR
jgi:molecular chaperone DnaK (HSP70)